MGKVEKTMNGAQFVVITNGTGNGSFGFNYKGLVHTEKSIIHQGLNSEELGLKPNKKYNIKFSIEAKEVQEQGV